MSQRGVPRIAAGQRRCNNPLDEIGFRASVSLASVGIDGHGLGGQAVLQLFVLACRLAMVAKIVPKGQRSSLFSAAGLDDVNMVSVRPLGRPMEKRAERVVGMRRVHVARFPKRFLVRRYGIHPRDGHLDIDDRFGREAGDRRRTMVIDAHSNRTKRVAKTDGLSVELAGPPYWSMRRSP